MCPPQPPYLGRTWPTDGPTRSEATRGSSTRPVKTYDINEAADFLKIDRSTALELAGTGTLPGAKVGRAWVFMEDELVAYLRDATRKQTQNRRATAEAIQILGRARQEATPLQPRRRRPLPELPELGGEVTAP